MYIVPVSSKLLCSDATVLSFPAVGLPRFLRLFAGCLRRKTRTSVVCVRLVLQCRALGRGEAIRVEPYLPNLLCSVNSS